MTRDEILALIPHAGAMCLLDNVVAWDDESIHCRSATHRDPAHPLQRMGRLAAVHLIEYGAQAVAVHGGLLARKRSEDGISGGALASVRHVELVADDIEGCAGALDIHAERELAAAEGLIYRFEVYSGERILARGRLTIMGRA